MKELNNSQHQLYIQAIKNPAVLSEDDLLQLIVRYPYSQPLIFAYERRKKQLDEVSVNKSLALLYAPSPSWLWSFINSERQVKSTLAEESIQDSAAEPLEEMILEEESIDSNISTEEIIDVHDSAQEKFERDELDALVSQGSVMADYFIFDDKSQDKPETSLVEVQKDGSENISMYNDDLMPYSFRWWLHKTRLEYAETYQPFAIPDINNRSNGTVIDFGKLDEAILDQQIKEHIIHFQDPEEKLSEQVKSRPIEQTQPKKTDTIIERFIREEPIIQAPSADNLNNENMARQSAEDNYVLVTETLANIYRDQGLYQKAIEVFRKLILKYPEKKSYFATQIKELEKNL